MKRRSSTPASIQGDNEVAVQVLELSTTAQVSGAPETDGKAR